MTDFEAAFKADNEPAPKDAGQAEKFTVSGLSGNRTYYFALITYDDGPNPSEISNVASIKTPPAPSAPNPPTVEIQDPQEGIVLKKTVVFTIMYSDLDNDVNEMEIFVNGEKVDSRTGITSPQTWEWDTEKGDYKVKNGDHTIKVTVTDRGGHTATDEVTYTVKNKKKEEPSGFIPGFEAVVVLSALVAVLIIRMAVSSTSKRQ
jgi:hypothetical protein